MSPANITDDLDILLDVLPREIGDAVRRADQTDTLLEIVMALGRKPEARYTDHELVLSDRDVALADIELVVQHIGEFDADNRAGIERTLHRISAIRNRHGHIVGLTCRVGRAVYGTIDIIQDIVASGNSVLILGRPGVGKTTMLREVARILADGAPDQPTRRVVIVDTSNEIGGDGDIPHPAVGRARRMQVLKPSLQHEVMIEAVENHNPEVIVIDEIGRELEALAARTIAERGVQLIGTAHGQTLDNLLLNPTLSDLVGGIEAVTLSDEEARRRGTQKTVLERRAPPTFDVLVEIQTRDRFAVHPDIMNSVDALLRGFPIAPEIRTRGEDGTIQIETAKEASNPRLDAKETPTKTARHGRQPVMAASAPTLQEKIPESVPVHFEPVRGAAQAVKIYPYGVARNRLMQAAKRLGVPAVVVKDPGEANALVTLRTYYRDRQQTIVDAEHRGLPLYVLRSSTVGQMEQFLLDLFNVKGEPTASVASSEMDAVKEQTEEAIAAVLNGERWVDLPPGPSLVRRIEHEMARQAELVSHSYGKEPRRHVRIFRE